MQIMREAGEGLGNRRGGRKGMENRRRKGMGSRSRVQGGWK